MADYYGHGGGGITSKPGSSLAHSDSAKIFVGGLSWQTTEESLRWHFEQYGSVISVEVMRHRHTGEPRGFAFVVFSDPATVDLVMKDKDKHEINHKLVDVKRAQARGVAPPSIHGEAQAARPKKFESSNSGGGEGGGGGNSELTPEQMHCKVFVGGLPPHVDRHELKNVFEQFGTVTDAIVMVDSNTQKSRGFGFVTFDDAEAAQRSIVAQPVNVSGRRAEVKLATPREGQVGRPSRPQQAPKHLGLRAGQSSSTTTGPYAGLSVAYGRSGWKAGYGTKAFGKFGWDVFEDTGAPVPDKAGFSFSMLNKKANIKKRDGAEPPPKRSRH